MPHFFEQSTTSVQAPAGALIATALPAIMPMRHKTTPNFFFIFAPPRIW
jgi:hypothetical protein